jgi:hypothetical protein
MVRTDSRILRSSFAKTAAALLLAGSVSACLSTGKGPASVSLPPAPLPTYQQGDSFVYQDRKGVSRVRRVVSVKGDRVDWVTEEDYRFTTYRNPFLPSLSWDGESSSGTMTSPLIPDQLWPLEYKNYAEIRPTYRKLEKDNGKTSEYEEHWRCKVNKPRNTTVPAGTFKTYKVLCRRYDPNDRKKVTRTHIWYYAPAVGHFVKRIKKYESGRRKTIELVSFTRGASS